MTVLRSYELNGKKLSFANWISWLSPRDTPFISMTKKGSVRNTRFNWQNDSLISPGENAAMEGGTSSLSKLIPTTEQSNVTQIFRKTIKVSDTAKSVKKFGAKSELEYQLKKAVEEIKLDMELAFLSKQVMKEDDARETAGFFALTAGKDEVDAETNSIVHRAYNEDDWLTEEHVFDITNALYEVGSHANVIMFPPDLSPAFSALQLKGVRRKVFENSDKVSYPISILVDPLGREFKLIPNRWMPENTVYFFNPDDWTQMLLREPKRELLAKDGSYEKWMVEVEVGLRHTNKFSSGILRKGV